MENGGPGLVRRCMDPIEHGDFPASYVYDLSNCDDMAAILGYHLPSRRLQPRCCVNKHENIMIYLSAPSKGWCLNRKGLLSGTLGQSIWHPLEGPGNLSI